jgi:hypothetical protein
MKTVRSLFESWMKVTSHYLNGFFNLILRHGLLIKYAFLGDVTFAEYNLSYSAFVIGCLKSVKMGNICAIMC